MRPIPRLLPLLGLALITAACDPREAPPEASTDAVVSPARPFDDAFSRVREVVLEQTDSHLIARVNDLALGGDGRLYLVDASEGNVKVYAPDGRLDRVLGRKGEGPGEFAQPWRAAVDASGRIHVADLGLSRIVVFDSSGQVLRTVSLWEMTGVNDMALLPRQAGYALATSWSRSPDAIVLVDTTGAPIRGFPPSSTITAGGAPDSPVWDFPRIFSLSRRDDRLFASASVSNTLWEISLEDQSVDSTAVSFEGYDPPVLPPTDHEAWQNGRSMMEWFMGRHLNGYVLAYDGGVLWPFVRGEYIGGNGEVTLLHRSDRTGDWEALTDPPVLLAASGSYVVGIDTSSPDRVRVLLFEARIDVPL